MNNNTFLPAKSLILCLNSSTRGPVLFRIRRPDLNTWYHLGIVKSRTHASPRNVVMKMRPLI